MEQKDKCCFPAISLLFLFEMEICVLMDCCISFGMNNTKLIFCVVSIH